MEDIEGLGLIEVQCEGDETTNIINEVPHHDGILVQNLLQAYYEACKRNLFDEHLPELEAAMKERRPLHDDLLGTYGSGDGLPVIETDGQGNLAILGCFVDSQKADVNVSKSLEAARAAVGTGTLPAFAKWFEDFGHEGGVALDYVRDHMNVNGDTTLFDILHQTATQRRAYMAKLAALARATSKGLYNAHQFALAVTLILTDEVCEGDHGHWWTYEEDDDDDWLPAPHYSVCFFDESDSIWLDLNAHGELVMLVDCHSTSDPDEIAREIWEVYARSCFQSSAPASVTSRQRHHARAVALAWNGLFRTWQSELGDEDLALLMGTMAQRGEALQHAAEGDSYADEHLHMLLATMAEEDKAIAARRAKAWDRMVKAAFGGLGYVALREFEVPRIVIEAGEFASGVCLWAPLPTDDDGDDDTQSPIIVEEAPQALSLDEIDAVIKEFVADHLAQQEQKEEGA